MAAISTPPLRRPAAQPRSTAISRGHRRNDVAVLLGQSPRTVDRLLAAGWLVASYPLGRGRGKPVWITDDSLQRFIETAPQRLTEPEADEPAIRDRSDEKRHVLDQLEDCVARVVATAPPLSTERRERLAVILGGGA